MVFFNPPRLAHLVLGRTGISGVSNETEIEIEKFCNEVASSILIPDLEKIVLEAYDTESIIDEITVYSEKWNVSYSQLAYRLYLRGDYAIDVWKTLSNKFRDMWLKQRVKEKKKNKESDNGPSPYAVSYTHLTLPTILLV